MTALLDRQLLFVTGKGGVGKTIDRRPRSPSSPRERASARSCARWTPRARWPTRSTSPRSSSSRREVTPNLWAHGDEHRGLAARVPPAVRAHPAARADRPARPHVRLRRRRGAGREGDPRRRQADATRSRRTTTTSSSSTPRRAVTSSPRSVRRARSASWSRSGLVRDQTGWMIDILEDPCADGTRHRHDAGGDAGDGDDRAARAGAAGDRRRRSPPSIANRVLPALFSEREARGVRARSTEPVPRAMLAERRREPRSAPCSMPPR